MHSRCTVNDNTYQNFKNQKGGEEEGRGYVDYKNNNRIGQTATGHIHCINNWNVVVRLGSIQNDMHTHTHKNNEVLTKHSI